MQQFEKNNTRFTIYQGTTDSTQQAMLLKHYPGNCDPSREDFIGRAFDTWQDAADAANGNWVEGHSMLKGMIDELKKVSLPKPVDRRRKVNFNAHGGDEVDLDRLRAGQMEFWRTAKRQKADGPQTLTLLVDATAPYNMEWKDAAWRGAAAIALCYLLEEAGYRVELWSVQGSKAYGQTTQITGTILKKHSDPLNQSSLLNAVSTWFYRTITFRNILENSNGGYCKSSLGACHTPSPRQLDEFTTDPNRVYVSHCFSKRNAVQIVERELRKFSDEA